MCLEDEWWLIVMIASFLRSKNRTCQNRGHLKSNITNSLPKLLAFIKRHQFYCTLEDQQFSFKQTNPFTLQMRKVSDSMPVYRTLSSLTTVIYANELMLWWIKFCFSEISNHSCWLELATAEKKCELTGFYGSVITNHWEFLLKCDVMICKYCNKKDHCCWHASWWHSKLSIWKFRTTLLIDLYDKGK